MRCKIIPYNPKLKESARQPRKNMTLSKDALRQKRLESLDVRFLLFTDHDVKRNIDGVLQRIENWIRTNETHPYAGRAGTIKAEKCRAEKCLIFLPYIFLSLKSLSIGQRFHCLDTNPSGGELERRIPQVDSVDSLSHGVDAKTLKLY